METTPQRARLITIFGGAAAAATAAFVASRLGVAGTIVGAAVASIVASIGAEVYARAASRSALAVATLAQRRQVAGLVDDAVGDEALVPGLDPAASQGAGPALDDDPADPDDGGPVVGVRGVDGRAITTLRFSWRHVALVAAGVFVVVLAAITIVEVVIGKPISSLWGGDSSSGTSIGQAVRPKPAATSPAATPTPTPSVAPTTVPTLDPTSTPRPTPTVTVTVTVAPPVTPASPAGAATVPAP